LKKDLEKKIQQIESGITSTELKKTELETELAMPEVYANHERFLALNTEYSEVISKLETLTKEWEGLVERLSSL